MRVFAFLGLLAVAGCGTSAGASGGPSPVCTEIGGRTGVGVTITAPLAGQVRDATLSVCWAGKCHDQRLELEPSTVAGNSTCSSDQPDGVCSAPAHATGDRNGFADLSGLPSSPVSTSLTLTGGNGANLVRHAVDITPKPLYPNGPQCPSSGTQAHLVVDSRGNVHES